MTSEAKNIIILIGSILIIIYGIRSIVTKKATVDVARWEIRGITAILWGILGIIGGLLLLYGYFTNTF